MSEELSDLLKNLRHRSYARAKPTAAGPTQELRSRWPFSAMPTYFGIPWEQLPKSASEEQITTQSPRSLTMTDDQPDNYTEEFAAQILKHYQQRRYENAKMHMDCLLGHLCPDSQTFVELMKQYGFVPDPENPTRHQEKLAAKLTLREDFIHAQSYSGKKHYFAQIDEVKLPPDKNEVPMVTGTGVCGWGGGGDIHETDCDKAKENQELRGIDVIFNPESIVTSMDQVNIVKKREWVPPAIVSHGKCDAVDVQEASKATSSLRQALAKIQFNSEYPAVASEHIPLHDADCARQITDDAREFVRRVYQINEDENPWKMHDGGPIDPEALRGAFGQPDPVPLAIVRNSHRKDLDGLKFLHRRRSDELFGPNLSNLYGEKSESDGSEMPERTIEFNGIVKPCSTPPETLGQSVADALRLHSVEYKFSPPEQMPTEPSKTASTRNVSPWAKVECDPRTHRINSIPSYLIDPLGDDSEEK